MIGFKLLKKTNGGSFEMSLIDRLWCLFGFQSFVKAIKTRLKGENTLVH